MANRQTKPTARKTNPLTSEMKAFLKVMRGKGTLEAISSLERGSDSLDEMLRSNARFAHAYYQTLGMTEKQVKFLKVFEKKMCNIKQTCDAIGINRSTYYDWMEKNDIFNSEISAINEGVYDDVETILHQKIFVEKETTSLIWFTRTKMKHRGYVERVEQDVKASVNANVNHYKDLSDEELDRRIKEMESKTK